jgi:uncharacterized membrane protein
MQAEAPRPKRAYGMTVGRLEAFSDGVFAIAVTLLILDVQLPRGDPARLAQDLVALWPEYATYAASFITIGIMWLNHHALFSRVSGIDRPLVLLNMFLLMIVAFAPFPTQVLGTHLGGAGAQPASLFYAVSAIAIAVAFSAVYMYVARHPALIERSFRDADFMAAVPWFSAGLVAYLAATVASLFSPTLVIVIVAGTAIYYAFDHLPGPVQAAPGADRPGID